MGRQTSITVEHVKTAIAALRAEGKSVSSRSVREKLGNMGSMGTVNRLVQQALCEQEHKPQSLRQLPPEIQHAFLAFVDQQAEEARRQIAEELLYCRQEMAELANDNDLRTSTIDDLEKQLAHSMSQTASTEGQVKQLTSELANMREAAAIERNKSEALQIELLKMQIRLDVLAPLEGELRHARTKYDMQSSAYLKLEQNVAVLEAQKNSLEEQQSRLHIELTDAHLVRNKLADKVEATSLLLEREREARMLAERELAVTTATWVKRRAFRSGVNAGKRQP